MLYHVHDATTGVPGIKVGHAQNREAATGCTVVLLGDGAVTGADVRGGSPGTREISALDPVNAVKKAHAVYLGGGNTTLGIVATNAKLSQAEATKIAMMAHDGFARAINPIHTMYDGDTIFCSATGEVDTDLTTLGALAADITARAIVRGIEAAETAAGNFAVGNTRKID